MKDCPQARVFETEQQPSPAIVPARNSNNGKGCQQIGQGGNKIGSCGGRGDDKRGRGNTQPGREVARVDERARCYVFPGKNEAEASDAVITGTIFVCDRMTNVLPLILRCYVKFLMHIYMFLHRLESQS